ncbi:MAG: DoxX family protein [Kutzneria sp.]|nr:DoxX family protein [Kutzneria sp.]
MHLIDRNREYVVSLFRMVVGLLFAFHGIDLLFGVITGGRPAVFGHWPGWWAAVIETVAGGLVLAGLFTRVAAVICSGSMAYAYFTVHQPKTLFPMVNGGEPAALFCWAFLLLVFIGPGLWSLDALVRRAGANSSAMDSSLSH